MSHHNVYFYPVLHLKDGAFPWSWIIRPVSRVTKTPLMTVVLVFVVDCLLLLLPLRASQGEIGEGQVCE